MAHSEVLHEAVSQTKELSFSIDFFESERFETEKTDDFEIGQMLYIEVLPSTPLATSLDWVVNSCRLSHEDLSYTFYENVFEEFQNS